ncbi:Cation efflux system protein CzcA [Nitrospira sp. KM1]|uniref:efflux RND transporter permease subunit n=1 Tax=Nitrospira sp. KM1 TaxID=1936990 RepID=UPI0013A7643E|nr:CusA/CzcA family heavy metal efflux RND transporter [Nitrospira sp. KM1]BCA56013.1 Cation efflux system protein CzcA [Nitrospira sp. KM1]
MITALIELSLRQRIIIFFITALFAGLGLYAFRTMPIDAFPDVTPILVQVVTKASGFSPAEVERFVTFPLELQLTGAPGLKEIRSLSKVGLSMIDVVFEDDVDIYLARQIVLERVLEAKESLPKGITTSLVPNTTGLGEVYQFFLEGPNDDTREMTEAVLTERRTLQDWVIRPLLKGLPGVVEVNSMGGFVKQYQVLINPGLLRKYDLALHEVFQAVERNNANAAGSLMEKHGEKYIVRGIGLITSVKDIENIVLKEFNGTPIRVHDVADVEIGHAVRHGAAVVDGKREVVSAMVLMLRGANAKEVVESVKHKIDEIHEKRLLPDGLRIVPFYDRIELITAALKTVYKALLEGVTFVVIILFLFLGHLRSSLAVALVLIVAPLMTFIIMKTAGLSANLMSLGGLAISIGMIADAAIIQVENVERHLNSLPTDKVRSLLQRLPIVRRAVLEVRAPSMFGELIIALTFLPLLSLAGMEGKMFSPLALTIIIALFASLLLSLTLSPVLCLVLLKGGGHEEGPLVRWGKRAYLPALHWAMRHRPILLSMVGILLLAAVLIFPFLGGEFIPILNEGALTPQVIRLPSIALDQSIEVEKTVHRTLLEFPEVTRVVSKIGRSELGNDPQEVNVSDPIVSFSPIETWTTASRKSELDDAIRRRLETIRGASFLLTQPIQQRVDEFLSGVRSEATVKIIGEDLDVLRKTAHGIQAILALTPGVKDTRVEQLFGQEYVTIEINRDLIARHAINIAEIRDIISTAIGETPATEVYEGQRRFQLIVRYAEQYRDSVEDLREILLKAPDGAIVPLSDVAKIEIRQGPSVISREGLQRRIYVGFNTFGRDIEGIVAEASKKIQDQVRLPPGYSITWGGSFQNMQHAMARLRVIVPLTIGLIFFLLYISFNSIRYAALIILNLPFAMVGGILALWITGEYLSVPASVGFINLFGVAVLNGIVLVSYIVKLREGGEPSDQAIINGCLLRFRPVLMTALVALLALIPLAFAHGIGSEVQRPLAVVVIGGLLTSTPLTLLVIPALFPWFDPPRAEADMTGLEEESLEDRPL